MNSIVPRLLLAGGLLALVTVAMRSPTASAQPTASSVNYFMLCPEMANGGNCASTNHKLNAWVGAGVVGRLAFSSNYKLLGGVNACPDTPVAGTPWLSGAAPFYGPLLGGTTHVLRGHNLALGTATNVTVGGQAATVVSRARDRVVIKLPAQMAPGYATVTATANGKTAHLVPKGIGVLPMVYLPWPITKWEPWQMVYQGSPGDLIWWTVATHKLSPTLTIPPYHHALELNLGTLVVPLAGPWKVTDPSGKFVFPFPGGFVPRPLYVQMLVLTTSKTGYQPGCFTNTIAL